MEREQFTFYRSFWEALKALPKKDQLPFVMAVCSYALDGESKPISGAPYASFLLVKPILDKASKKAANGKQGGSKPKANGKQTGSKPNQTESHIEGEEEIEGEREMEGDNPPTPLAPASSLRVSPPTFEQVLEAAKMKGCPECAKPFFDYYAAAGWRDSEGKPCAWNWQQKLVAWRMREEKRRKPGEKRGIPASYDYEKTEGSL